jgi:glutamate racemase
LGVIRPTTEIIGNFTKSRKIGILATNGTVQSGSYLIEIEKFFPDIAVYQEACPMWVPIVENNEYTQPGADYFVKKHVQRIMSANKDIDTLLLACTHYPLLRDKIAQFLPAGITVVSQGEIVAASLNDYLHRHAALESRCSKSGQRTFYTTDSTEDFDNHASIFFGEPVHSNHVDLDNSIPVVNHIY